MTTTSDTPSHDTPAGELHDLADLYVAEDLAAAATAWPRGEVVAAFKRYRRAVDQSDHETMAAMLSDDGRAGNATYGLFSDRAAYLAFLKEAWLSVISNLNVWQLIEGGRVVNKWVEILPGTPPAGMNYNYYGINEVIYAGNGQFRFMYSLPDLFGLSQTYRRWKEDGHHNEFGDVYPGASG